MLKRNSHEVLEVGKLLFPLFALALDLPENFFDDKVRFCPYAGLSIEA